jgi:hypothetical protein
MRLFFAITFLATASVAALAETPGLERVLSVATLSFESNGDTDRAVLVENDDAGADLYIYLGLDPSKSYAPIRPALVKKAAAWSGSMWGTRPSLETNDRGSLLIKSANETIGRSRWSQTLTIVYRNKEFIVAGLTRETSDTLDPKAGGSCDVNFVTGKGKRNGKPVEIKFSAMKFADWSDEKPPKECSF